MKTTVGFLEEKPGVKSSERLKSVLLVVSTIAFVFCWVIYKGNEPSTEFTFLVLVLLLAGVTPSGLRKIAEIRAGIIQPIKTEYTEKTETTQTS